MTHESAVPQPEQVAAFFRKHRTGLVTLVFTDLVDSTRLKQQLGDTRAVALVQQHHARVRDWLSTFGEATEIETAGDSFLLLFVRPSDAARFALGLHRRNRQLSEEAGVKLEDRIGIHAGEVFVQDQAGDAKLFGSQVDVCGRVVSLAQGGQILMTRFVFDNARAVLRGTDVEGVEALEWVSHGPYLLKGIEEAAEVCEVGEAGQSPLAAPKTTEKAQRVVRADEEPVLGWRPAVGQEVPNTPWALEQKLGEGGFGEVWVALHHKLKERRVFKFCFRADRVRALKREMTLFRLLKEHVGEHPNIVRLYEVYLENPPFYLEEEYIEGKDLRTWCEGEGGVEKVPLETRLEIVAQAADALQAAHDAGIIHRDVKPGNILVSGQRSVVSDQREPADSSLFTRHSSLQVKLTDFGIGQVVSEEVLAGVTRAGFTQTMLGGTSSGTGTTMYLAPEIVAGRPATTRSDTYSLGVVLYQLLMRDFTRPLTIDWVKGIDHPLLRDDLQHCLAGDPAGRFVGAGQLAKNLRAWEQRRAEEAKRERLRRQAAQRRRIAALSAGVAAGLVLLAAAMGFGLIKAREQRDQARLQAYVADMKIADSAWRENNLGQALSVLRHHIPKAGDQDLRGLEWRYLWHRCRGDETASLRHRAAVPCVDVSSDGRWVVSQCDGKFWLWDVDLRKVVQELGPASMAGMQQGLAFSPTGRFLATAAPNGIVIWDALTWQRVRTLPCTNAVVAFSGDGSTLGTFGEEGVQTWKCGTWQVQLPPGALTIAADGERALALNLDGSLLVASIAKGLVYSRQRADRIALWHLPDRACLLSETNVLKPKSLALSNDGRWLAAGTWAGRVHLWPGREPRAARALSAHQGLVMALAFAPDSQTLASGGNDQLIQLWEPGTASRLWTLKGHESEVWGVRFSADQRWLVSASKDATVRLWQTSKPVPKVRSFAVPPGRLVNGIRADARRFFSINPQDWTSEEWDTASSLPISKVSIQGTNWLGTLGPPLEIQRSYFIIDWRRLRSRGPGRVVSASTMGAWALTAGTDDGRVYAWSGQTGGIIYSNQLGVGPLGVVGCSRDSRRFAVLELTPAGPYHLMIWNLVENRRETTFTDVSFGPPTLYAVSSDGSSWAYPTTNGHVVIWDAPGRRMKSRIRGHMTALTALALSPNGSLLGTASGDGTAQVWNTTTAKPVTPPLVGHLSGVVKLGFLPEGRTLVTYSDDLTARVWNVATGCEMISALPLNELLKEHTRLQLISDDGNVVVEPDGEGGLRFVRLPTLAEIDAAENAQASARPVSTR